MPPAKHWRKWTLIWQPVFLFTKGCIHASFPSALKISCHCQWRQNKVDGGRFQLSCRTWASKEEEAVIQWGGFRGRATRQGKIQNFNISSHLRFFVDGISSENGSVFQAEAQVWPFCSPCWHLLKLNYVNLRARHISRWHWRRSVWGWANSIRWLH